MSKLVEFNQGVLLSLKQQMMAYGTHLLEGGNTAAWNEIIEIDGLIQVDQVLFCLLQAYVVSPLTGSAGSELVAKNSADIKPELEAFIQVSHACMHELLVHFRDRRHFAVVGWKRLESVLLETLAAIHSREKSDEFRIHEEVLRDFLLIASDSGFQLSTEVRQSVRDWMEDSYEDDATPSPKASDKFWKWQDPFLSMLNQVSEGGSVVDEFDCFDNIETQITFLPEHTLVDVLAHGLSFDRAEVKEIVPLMVMHACEDVAQIALDILEESTGSLTPLGLSRLIAMRNWLPASRRTRLDHIARAARLQFAGNECNEDQRFTDVTVVKHLVSTVDGAGAQNVITLLKSRFGHKAFVGVVKEHIGWIDIWSSRWTTRAECDRLVRSFQKSVYTLEVNQDYIEFIFRQGLAWNNESGIIPRPEYLHWVELLRDTQVNPRDFDHKELCYLLDLEPDTKPTPFQVRQAMEASGDWLRQGEFAMGWFEVGDHVEDYLANHFPEESDGVLEHSVRVIFEPLRGKWSERLRRMAFWAHCNVKRRGPKMMDFFVMASLIESDLPLEHLHFIRDLAMATLSAYAHEHEE